VTDDLLALVVADDLTGAADSAVAFAGRGVPTRVVFDLPSSANGPGVLAVDTDTRRADPVTAADLVTAVVTSAPRGRVAFKKIDSTLRGNVAAETEAMLRASGAALAVCAPAFPRTGRTLVDGVQRAHGEAIGDVPGLFAGVPVDRVPLAAVREGSLDDRLASAARNGARVVVVDSETDADLSAVARAGGAVPAPVVWVGSGGLAAALARALVPEPAPVQLPSVAGPVLVVVGSGAPQSAAQAAAFRDTGACEVAFPAAHLLSGDPAALSPAAERVARQLGRGTDVLVRIEEGHRVPSGEGRDAVTALARALAAAEPAPACLVVTGGETARTLTVAMGATGLALAGELHPGVVVGRLTGGLTCPVVTKAGGFGEPAALVDAVAGLRSGSPTAPVQPGPAGMVHEES
jgi:D-threonate/D-erythronate kinase